MSARRFRHRDRQQVRPGLPQQAPGGAPPGIRIRSIRHYAPPHTAARPFGHGTHAGHSTLRIPGRIRFGHQRYGTPRASGARHPAHAGHWRQALRASDFLCPRHPALAGHWRQAHRAPGCIRFGNQVSRVPDIRRCRASCVGHEKVGHEKGESGIGFPFGRPCCARIPGGGAISSRAGRSTRASTYRP